jgi:hypothetical protein
MCFSDKDPEDFLLRTAKTRPSAAVAVPSKNRIMVVLPGITTSWAGNLLDEYLFRWKFLRVGLCFLIISFFLLLPPINFQKVFCQACIYYHGFSYAPSMPRKYSTGIFLKLQERSMSSFGQF